MLEFNLWNPDRFKVFQMRQRFQLGPFECGPALPREAALVVVCTAVRRGKDRP